MAAQVGSKAAWEFPGSLLEEHVGHRRVTSHDHIGQVENQRSLLQFDQIPDADLSDHEGCISEDDALSSMRSVLLVLATVVLGSMQGCCRSLVGQAMGPRAPVEEEDVEHHM